MRDLRGLIQKLLNRETFSISRFGDGEFACMLGHGPANCDRHEYTEELRTALIRAAKRPVPGVTYGLMAETIESVFGDSAKHLLKYKAFDNPAPSRLFEHLSRAGNAWMMANYLRDRESVVVGPRWLRDLPFVADSSCGFVCVPELNCFIARKRIIEGIVRYIRKGWDTFSISASLASSVLIHDIFTKHRIKPHNVSLLDVGALWDPYVGKFNRAYHKERTAEEWGNLLKS